MSPGRRRAAPGKRRERPDTEAVAGVPITHPDRVVYPEDGITKVRLARYYEAVAPHLLPHLGSRPVVLVRCPDGIAHPCFYQKHAGPWTPRSLRRVRIREKTKTGQYVVVENVTGLVGLVQMGTIEFHTWNAAADRLEVPDRLVFDLDPGPDVPWPAVVAAARLVRATLEARDLASFVKTTGGKGLHVVAPIEPGPGWDACTAFASDVAEALAAETSRAFTTTMAKAARPGRIFIDYFRNQRGATSVAAYSARARPGAPVSTPIAWDELDKVRAGSEFTIDTVERRLAKLARDPWAGYGRLAQKLRPVRAGARRSLPSSRRDRTSR